MHSFLLDLRYALRQLRKSPGFAIVAILTLALGIGVATTMFAIVDGVSLRPLVFPQANQLYTAAAVGAGGDVHDWIPYTEIRQWQRAVRDSAQIVFSRGNLEIAESPSGALLVSNDALSPNFLRTLGVQPMLGRDFLPEEQLNGHARVVILSYPVWQNAFEGNRKILGQTLRMDGVPYKVIGIMPPHFARPLQGDLPQVFTPVDQNVLLKADEHTKFRTIVRLKPDATVSGLQAQLSSVQAHLTKITKPGDEVATHVQLTGLRSAMVANVRPALTALEIAVGLLWLIACCNVAGLLLARLSSRRVEIAVRGALGAGKWRIVRQFLMESLLLSGTGAAAGLGLAALTLEVFRREMAQDLPLSQNIHLSPTVLLALVGFTLLTGFLFGIIPAVIAACAPIETALKSGGPAGSRDRGQARLRNALLIGEVALSIVLLVAAGLMLRTVYALRHTPLGFRTDHIVLASFHVPNYDYKNRDLNTALWNPLLQRVRHLPGVQSAALSTVMPIGHTMELVVTLKGQNWAQGGNVSVAVRAASPGLTKALGMRMHAGRFFTTEDTLHSMPVMVVNQAFVRDYFGGGDVIGKQIQLGDLTGKATIVGVLDDVRQDHVATPSMPEVYLCIAQLKPATSLSLVLEGRVMELAVRTRTSPSAMIPELRRAIHDQNPNLAVENFSTMEQAVSDSIGNQRLAARVISIFGSLALLITVIGLYGLLSYSVTQRTREIGIRMALGADKGRVMRMVLRQAFVLLVAGIAAGLALAFWADRFLHSFLYGVGKHDPWTLAVVPCVLVLGGMLAAFFPARRAASVDPMQALRAE